MLATAAPGRWGTACQRAPVLAPFLETVHEGQTGCAGTAPKGNKRAAAVLKQEAARA